MSPSASLEPAAGAAEAREPADGLRVLTHASTLHSAGGVETALLDLATALAGRGHRLEVLHGGDGELAARYREAGVALHGGHRFDFAPRTAARDLASFVPSVRRARAVRADVLWLHRFEHVMWAQSVARASRTPVVCHLHHVPNYRRLGLLSRGIAHFVAVSHWLRDVWVAGGLPPERVSVVHNAVPARRFPRAAPEEERRARERLGVPADARVAAYYGRLTTDKGVDVLLRAWQAMPRRAGERRHLLVVGAPGEGDAALGRQVAELAAGGGATVLPPRPDVLPVLHAADVVVLPSVAPEGFGRVLIEALSTGRPAVASRAGATPEVLAGDLARFLVPPGDPAALARALDGALRWRDDEPALGDECARAVGRRFPFGTAVEAVEAALAGAARRSPPRRPRPHRRAAPRRTTPRCDTGPGNAW